MYNCFIAQQIPKMPHHFQIQTPIKHHTTNNFYNVQATNLGASRSRPTICERLPLKTLETRNINSNLNIGIENKKRVDFDLRKTLPSQFLSPQRPISSPINSVNYFASPQNHLNKNLTNQNQKVNIKPPENTKKPIIVKNTNMKVVGKENKKANPTEKRNRKTDSIKKIDEVLKEEEVSRIENSQNSRISTQKEEDTKNFLLQTENDIIPSN